jgi:hypothetical protein
MSFVRALGWSGRKKEETSKELENVEWPRAKMAPQSFIDWKIFAASTARRRAKERKR